MYTHNINKLLSRRLVLVETHARVCVHTPPLKCHFETTLSIIKNPYLLNQNDHSLKTDASPRKPFLPSMAGLIGAHVPIAHPAPGDTAVGLHTCVRPVVVFHGGGREE